jgi:hypothetical protein
MYHLDGHPVDRGVLDTLFGIKREASARYMNGKEISEMDAEKYEKPFLERFPLALSGEIKSHLF